MSIAAKYAPCTSQGSKVEFRPEQTFDRTRMHHLVEGEVSVLHCHHYASLITQLALDAEPFGGPSLLMKASAGAFCGVLKRYYAKHAIRETADRIAIAEQYFAFMGLGQIRFECTNGAVTVTMRHSHMDEGWMKKWGPRPEPVNYIGQGYIQGACAAIYDVRDPQAVGVKEAQSIVSGASSSKFFAAWQGQGE